jgi:hypothetical protein
MGIGFIGENGGRPGVSLKNCQYEDADCGSLSIATGPL